MLTRTTELALRALIHVAAEAGDAPIAQAALAERFDCSPTYLGKTLGTLVKAGILESTRGARGGVRLARDAADITLLEVYEACQGVLLADYCEEVKGSLRNACGFHLAMKDLHEAMTASLSRWTLEALRKRPVGKEGGGVRLDCRMA